MSSSCYSTEPLFSGASLPTPCTDAKKRTVMYFYEPTIGEYSYGEDHNMEPRRIRMTDSLIEFYDLKKHLLQARPLPVTTEQMLMFHSREYIEFLSQPKPDTSDDIVKEYIDDPADCPVFDGLMDFCKASVGGTLGAATALNTMQADIAINWAGGLHHAKMNKAAGFCYVNDIVLGIQELLKRHQRVLYVDIDIHHGDGVEDAFYDTDRVMTVSFHKYDGDYFPGTGHIEETGEGKGKNYSLNVPLDDGMKDKSFSGLFRPVLSKVMEIYDPKVIVLQCGADSLAGDELGTFNLTVKGHAACLSFLRSFNVPLMVLGGGGYTINNVARCWCYETGVAAGVELVKKRPTKYFKENFKPSLALEVKEKHANMNSRKNLEELKNLLLQQLSELTHTPSVLPIHNEESTLEVPEEQEESMERRPEPAGIRGGLQSRRR